jgi:hypothetical protein
VEVAQWWGPIKITKQPAVDIELDLTPAQVEELQRRLTSWKPPPAPLAMKG